MEIQVEVEGEESVAPLVPRSRRALIVHRNPLFAESLCRVLHDDRYLAHSLDAPVPAHLELELASAPIDVVIVAFGRDAELAADINLVRTAAAVLPAGVVVVAEFDQRIAMAQAIEAGAAASVMTTDAIPVLLAALDDASRGGTSRRTVERSDLLDELRRYRDDADSRLGPFQSLTGREGAVLGCMMMGSSAAEIAEECFVGVATVRTQIRAVLRKLEVRSQLAAVAMAYQAGWQPSAAAGGHAVLSA